MGLVDWDKEREDSIHNTVVYKADGINRAIKCLRDQLTPAHKRRAVFIACMIIFSAIFDVFGLASILPLIKLAAEPDFIKTNSFLSSIYTTFGFTNEKQLLLFFILMVFAFFLFKNAFGLWVSRMQTRFSGDVSSQLSHKQLSKFYSLDYFSYSNINSAIIINNCLRNPNSFIEFVLSPLIMLFSEMIILTLIITGVALFNLNLFAFLILTVGPFSILTYYIIRKRNIRIGRQIEQNYPHALSNITQAIQGYIDVKIANKEEYFKNMFTYYQSVFQRSVMSSYLLTMVPFRANEIVALLGMVMIFIYSIFWSDASANVLTMVGAFVAAAYRLMPSINRITTSVLFINKNQQSIVNLYTYEEFITPHETDEATSAITFKNEITLKNISFKFPSAEKQVLKNVNLTVKKGEKIGFVGASGSGKTTLMNILLRFFIENSGEILIDGVPLKKNNTRSWRNLIGYVKQDIYLFDESIKSNIALGEENIDEKQLTRALKQASLYDFIMSLPKGWDSFVGERGSKLSGGQRQRIGIARSLYRNAEILIFDEATSALDNQTEMEVSESIDALSDSNKTIFIIAHRVTTLKNCDRIYELKDGEISGVYSYEDLVEKVV